MIDRRVETNGIRLHYLEHPGPAPTVVLAPGLTANAHSFDGLAAAGLTEFSHVLALDLRGRGESDHPDSGYSIEDHAQDVLGLLDALGLQRVVMGGHSFGALLTFWLAANHPERIERCIVLDPPAHVHPGVVEQIRPSLDRLGVVYASWEGYVDFVRAMPYFDEAGWSAEFERYFRADVRVLPDGRVRAHARPEHMQAAVEGTLAVDWPATVARVAQPTLLLRAPGPFGPPGSPPILAREDAERTVALLPSGELRDGVGNHLTFVFGDGAGVLVRHIRTFLAPLEQAA